MNKIENDLLAACVTECRRKVHFFLIITNISIHQWIIAFPYSVTQYVKEIMR